MVPRSKFPCVRSVSEFGVFAEASGLTCCCVSASFSRCVIASTSCRCTWRCKHSCEFVSKLLRRMAEGTVKHVWAAQDQRPHLQVY